MHCEKFGGDVWRWITMMEDVVRICCAVTRFNLEGRCIWVVEG